MSLESAIKNITAPLRAATTPRRREIRTAFLSAARMNTRALPAGLAGYEAKRARSLEARARGGHVENVAEWQLEIADRVIAHLARTAQARQAIKAAGARPSRLARRVLRHRRTSLIASRMIEHQRQMRAAIDRHRAARR